MTRRRRFALGVAVVAVVAVTGCADYPKIACETFARDRSCPLEGVTAAARPDLSYYDLTWGKPKPPADIASDPARVSIWQAEEDRSRATSDSKMTVYLLTGCKEKHYYSCGRGKSGGFCAQMAAPVK